MPAKMQFINDGAFNNETLKKSALNNKKTGTFGWRATFQNLAIRKNKVMALQIAKINSLDVKFLKNNLQKRFQPASLKWH